eukprot:10323551-Ditylum_brightwellii.AAC.1
MQYIKCKIHLVAKWQPTPQQQNDICLMDAVLNSAAFLSYICHTDGHSLSSMMSSKVPPTTLPYTQDYEWLRQKAPNETTWQNFTSTLWKILYNADGRLKWPLRPWVIDSDK